MSFYNKKKKKKKKKNHQERGCVTSGFDYAACVWSRRYLMVAKVHSAGRRGSEVLNKDIFKVLRHQDISTPVVSLHFLA